MKNEYDFSCAKRGPIAQSKGKTRITIMLDDAVLDAARTRADEEGIGYQTLINSLLKEQLLENSQKPATKADLVVLQNHMDQLLCVAEFKAVNFPNPPAEVKLSQKEITEAIAAVVMVTCSGGSNMQKLAMAALQDQKANNITKSLAACVLGQAEPPHDRKQRGLGRQQKPRHKEHPLSNDA